MPDYFVLDYPTGKSAAELTAEFNGYGGQGWRICEINLVRQTTRRAIFAMGVGVAEYLVLDWDTGRPADELEAELDSYGVDGWELMQIDEIQQAKRRAVMMRGGSDGGGGGIAEAPSDGVTYGRLNTNWTPALALSNDVLDGGNF